MIITLLDLGVISWLFQITSWLTLAGLTGCCVLCWLFILKHRTDRKITSAIVVFKSFLRTGSLVKHVVLTSAVIQFATLIVMIAVARLLGIEVGFFVLFGIMAGSLLVSRLPISVAGWGVREGVLVSFLSAYGVAAEKAFATSIIYGLTELIAAMLALLISSVVPLFVRFFPTQQSSGHQ